MNTRRWAATASATLLLTGGLLAGTATSAFAAPENCTASYTGSWASSLCTTGTGEHRIMVLERHFMPGAGPILVEGPWAPVGSVSYTKIPPHEIVNVWIQTRG